MKWIAKVGTFIDRWYVGGMGCIASGVMYLNWHAIGMLGLLPLYKHFKIIIQNGFKHADLVTFPMWGYGWLMVVTESQFLLLAMQMGLALGSFYYFVQLLEQEKLFSVLFMRIFKLCMIVSLPWYAFHALRWPSSIAISLLLLSMVLLYKAVCHHKSDWMHVIASAVCFGLSLHFRADYFLMPLGFVFLILLFLPSKKTLVQVMVWLAVLYSGLIPWALYTKKVCGHYLLTSTNGGHVAFIGFGSDRSNRWGITVDDGDPVMHKLVNNHFKTMHHATLDYEADQFLKVLFFSYVRDYPWDYVKKCFESSKALLFGGMYSGEFFRPEKDGIDIITDGLRVRSILWKAFTEPFFLIQHISVLIRLSLHTYSWLLGKYLLLFSYCLLPFTMWYGAFKKRFLFISLVFVVIIYQTLLNIVCYPSPGYSANLYIFLLLNLLYGLSLFYTEIKGFRSHKMLSYLT